MYKKSFYNLEVENFEDNNVLMYNSLSNAIGIMNCDGKRLYDDIENIEVNNITNEKDKEILQTLINNGFIIDKNIDEFKLYKTAGLLGRFNSPFFGITIATTLDCNMACPYCYEEHKKIYMSKDVADGIVKFIENRFNNVKTDHLDITWYGGEPLLNLDIITYLSEKVIKLCEKENVLYNSFIVTNGVLLSESVSKTLSECKIYGAQITIDGPKDINDKRRLLLDGSSSFDIISNNIANAKNYLDINIRCNIDKSNVDSVDYLSDYFKELGVTMYVAPVDKLTDVCNAKIDDCFSSYEFKDIEMGVFKKELNESGQFLDFAMPSVKALGCGAISNNAYVIDPEGNLLKCWNHVGNNEKIIGTVETGEIFNGVNIEWLSLDIHEKCTNCKLLPSCGGGCPDITINTGTPKCSYRKFNSNDKIKLIYEKYMQLKNNPLDE